MYKIQNKSIEIQNHKCKNRLLDNYLDWVIYVMLPASIGDVLFPKFAAFSSAYGMRFAYIELNDTQVITDSSTSMTYDVQSNTINIKSETVGIKSKEFSITYNFDNLGTPFGTDNDTFEGLGFGLATVADFLLAYVDISSSQILYNTTSEYGASRVDLVSTNETSISGGYGYLPGETAGELQAITMCYTDNGSDAGKEYLVGDLTFTVVSAGNVSVTGFDDFYYTDDIIYPKTDLYPATDLYPTQNGTQIKSVRFRYLSNGTDATVYETYVAIKDLDVTYNGTDMSISLICERG